MFLTPEGATPAASAPMMALAAARAEVERIERQSLAKGASERVLSLGAPALDRALPGRGLTTATLHEITAADPGVGLGFTAALLARLMADATARGIAAWALWCLPRAGLYEPGNLYAPGLLGFGIDPGRILLARGRRDVDVLWAMEEGLREPALVAVVGEVRALDLNQSQRLVLAARRSGVTAFIVRGGGAAAALAEPSAAATRWHVQACSAEERDRLGRRAPAWDLALTRVRGGEPRRWRAVWRDGALAVSGSVDEQRAGEAKHGAGGFGLAAVVRDRPLAPQAIAG